MKASALFRFTSTRWWYAISTVLPVIFFTSFGSFLIEDLGWELFLAVGVVSCLSFVSVIGQLVWGFSDLVCHADYVYDLAISRMHQKNDVYEALLGPTAAIDPDNVIPDSTIYGGNGIQESDSDK
jgi:hypothetical protein